MPNIVSNAELLVAIGKTTEISDENQAVITLFHELVENAIKANLGYDPTYHTHTEYYPVQGFRQQSASLQLRHLPVRRVTSVITDISGYAGQAPNAFTSANGAETLVAGVGYFVRFGVAGIGGQNGLNNDDLYSASGILEHITGKWPCKPGSIKVTYVAGFTQQELAGHGTYHTAGQIKKATLDTMISSFKELVAQQKSIAGGKSGNVISEDFGDYSYTLDAMSVALTTFSVTLPPSAYANLQTHKNYGMLGM